jgi:CIC family chloride channel protein
VVTRRDILQEIERDGDAALARPLGELARGNAVGAYPDEPLRVVVYRMADTGFTRIPVVEHTTRRFLGLVSLNDLLKARTRHSEEESRRERTLDLRGFPPRRRGDAAAP